MVKQKNPEFLLYNLEPSLKRLKEDNFKEKRVKEKYIKKLFGENLQNIFSDLIFLEEEHYLLNPDTKEKDCVADGLAFSKKNSWFVIIEYKRKESLKLYEQTAEYISCLKDTKNPECIHNGRDLVEILKIKEKSCKWNYNNIHWDKTKGICIATEIYKSLRHHQRDDEQKDENIKIVEIKFYDEKNFLYIDTRKLPEWLTINLTETITKNKEKIIEQKTNYLDNITIDDEFDVIKNKRISPKIKEILTNLDKEISFKKNLTREVNIKKLNYYPVINYINRKKILLSVVVKVKQINIYWNFENLSLISQNLLNLLNKYQIKYSEKNHRGSGKWNFPIIDNEDNFQKLKNFIQEYEVYYNNSLKIN